MLMSCLSAHVFTFLFSLTSHSDSARAHVPTDCVSFLISPVMPCATHCSLSQEATGEPPRRWLRPSAARHRHRMSWARLLLATAECHLSPARRCCRRRPCCTFISSSSPSTFRVSPLPSVRVWPHLLPCSGQQLGNTFPGPAELFFTNEGATNPFSDNQKLRQITASTTVTQKMLKGALQAGIKGHQRVT